MIFYFGQRCVWDQVSVVPWLGPSYEMEYYVISLLFLEERLGSQENRMCSQHLMMGLSVAVDLYAA